VAAGQRGVRRKGSSSVPAGLFCLRPIVFGAYTQMGNCVCRMFGGAVVAARTSQPCQYLRRLCVAGQLSSQVARNSSFFRRPHNLLKGAKAGLIIPLQRSPSLLLTPTTSRLALVPNVRALHRAMALAREPRRVGRRLEIGRARPSGESCVSLWQSGPWWRRTIRCRAQKLHHAAKTGALSILLEPFFSSFPLLRRSHVVTGSPSDRVFPCGRSL
jgi:hypothetical protein